MRKRKLKGLGGTATVSKVTKLKKGGLAIDITCEICGKPITETNEYGMFCEDFCGLKAAKKAYEEMNKFIDEIVGEFDLKFRREE